MKKGLVIKNTGSTYWVKTDEGTVCQCKIKGKFRTQGIRSTNPIAIGDHVTFIEGEDMGLITTINKRRNFLVRRSINLSKSSHIIAANIDQACLITTIDYPPTTTTFIDRFLASCEAYNIPAILIFNKIDRYTEEQKEELIDLNCLYHEIGYTCLNVSAKTMQNMDKFKALLQGKISVLSGHSGVGKSTIINAIKPGAGLKTAAVSDYHHTGMHTTAHSELFQLDEHSAIIDTPGIRGFGIFDLNPAEIYHHFPEIFQRAAECEFHNCTHTHEPKCAVKQAIESGEIASSRYISYLSILEEDPDEKYRK